jgi:TAT (twin-arginine translocation) pathway signal sequence/Gluconate 2-dehydrogenase subunit 3
MNTPPTPSDRRTFLKLAGVLAAGSALPACTLESHPPDGQYVPPSDRASGLDRSALESLAEVVLPSELSVRERDVAIGAFVSWADDYEPVAEEMHGYGYADVRYLPPDPMPAWRAQLAALDLLASRTRKKSFASLPLDQRRAIVELAIREETRNELPSPLRARHVAVALLAHWSSSPAAWNLALGADVSPGNCRVLADANRKPLPIARVQS